ncbi:MAG: hypothetical protein NT166_02555 [Candidatus Aminicenantes bacterium]|nr:hypothetical protein [Candidatus Aminicenantes bacterium]
MNKHKKILTGVAAAVAVAILLAALTAWTTPAFAFTEGGSEEGQAQTGEHRGFNWGGFFGKLFDSTLLFGGLIYLLRKPLIDLLAQKSLDIKTDITQREERLKITSAQLKEILERLGKIEEEVQAVRDGAEKSGNEEKKRIEELGKNETRRILALTDKEIGKKMETAVRNLIERIADLTIEHFKRDIGAHLDPQMHEQWIEKYIAALSGDGIERK